MTEVRVKHYEFLNETQLRDVYPNADIETGRLKQVGFDIQSAYAYNSPVLVMLVNFDGEGSNYIGTLRLESKNANIFNAGIIMGYISTLFLLYSGDGKPFTSLQGSHLKVVFSSPDRGARAVAIGNPDGERYVLLKDLYQVGL